MQPYAKLSLQQREGILQYWASSPIPLLKKVCWEKELILDMSFPKCVLLLGKSDGMRGLKCRWPTQAFKGLKSIIASTIFNASDEKGRNPLWPAILYAGGALPLKYPPSDGIQLFKELEAQLIPA